MLESIYQASAWLVRFTDDFANSMVLLKEARNVKYSDFVRPGQTLVVTSELQKRESPLSWFKAQGTIDGKVAVSAKIILEESNLADNTSPV